MKNLLIISFAIAMISCGKQVEMISELKKSEEAYLLLLNANETNAPVDSIEYVENRTILDQVKLSEGQRGQLVDQFLNQENFEPLSGKCKYQPVYAVKINGKIYATFDVEYCPTVRYSSSAKKEQLLGIKAESELKKVVSEILPEK